MQLAAIPQMHPRALRDTPISAVILTNGDIDHIAGLLTIREKTAFDLYATQPGLDIVESNSVFRVLDPELVQRHKIDLDTPYGFEARKIYMHINNTNPILQPEAPERAEVLAKGWDIAADGMEIRI